MYIYAAFRIFRLDVAYSTPGQRARAERLLKRLLEPIAPREKLAEADAYYETLKDISRRR